MFSGRGTLAANAPKKKTGRPSKFTQALADRICKQRSEGKSLRSICRQASMPTASTVCKWLREKPPFSLQYAQACETDADLTFDELVALADRATAKDAQAMKLRIDTRKWVLSKRLPKKYGDRLELEHSGEVKGSLIIVRPGDEDADR